MPKIALTAALLLSIAACGGGSVSITAAGSTALLPLVEKAALEYQAEHPGVKISVSGGGSRAGIALVAQKAVDLGDSDTPANDPSLVDHDVAIASNGVTHEHLFTNGQPSAQVADFINFIETDTALLRRLNFVPVDEVSSASVESPKRLRCLVPNRKTPVIPR